MLAFESSEILHFDKHNITKFLKRFEKQCDEYEIIEKSIELNSFVIVYNSNFMKISSSYIDRN